ncbi:MAG: hypothetical protein KC933_10870 [Myxococcales bacterium]|nr:hypothetical protein [Myxococcales bacterium]MCB9650850.1 hypothetical protein [Deltaproteobacteria bacterium]
MKLGDLDAARRARLDALTRPAEGVRVVDPARVAAAADLLAAAVAAGPSPRATESPLGAARRLWDARGADGIPALARQVAAEGVAEHREALLCASKDELTAVVDQLALLCLDADDGAAPLDRLLDLKAVLSAGQDVAKAYRKRLKTTPAAQRKGAGLDPRWGEILDTLHERLEDVVRAERLATFAEHLGKASTRISRWARLGHLDAAARVSGGAVAGAMEAGRKVAGAVRSVVGSKGEGVKLPAWVKTAAAKFRALLDRVLPESMRKFMDSLSKGAHAMITALANVEADAGDPEALVSRFVKALDIARPLVDPSADAVALGVLTEAAVGVAGARGQELLYNRGTGQLTLNTLDTVGARIGIGVTARAFCRNLYGDGEAIAKSQGRSGLEVGALFGHAGFFTSHVPDVPADAAPRGWTATVALGYTLSIIGLANQSVYAVRERPMATVDLTPEQRAAIEAILARIPENMATYTDALGEAVKGA